MPVYAATSTLWLTPYLDCAKRDYAANAEQSGMYMHTLLTTSNHFKTTKMHSLLNPASTALTSSYATFWDWFINHERMFFHAVKTNTRIEEDFFDLLSPALDRVQEGLCFQTGISNDDTVELVISAEGAIENIVLVEELIHAAPALAGWKFTALKTATDIKDILIRMEGFEFNTDTLTFYSNNVAAFPDEINIVVVHQDYTQKHSLTLLHGVRIFLECHLGELAFANTIDRITVIGSPSSQQKLIPIGELNDYLLRCQEQYIKKNQGRRHSTAGDICATALAKSGNGNPLIAVVNTSLLAWEGKASHPWILVVVVNYGGAQHHGLPDNKADVLLNQLDADIQAALPDHEGYLKIARLTGGGKRELYFACQEFRKPSKVLYHLRARYASILNVKYEIDKDKYWHSLPDCFHELIQTSPLAL